MHRKWSEKSFLKQHRPFVSNFRSSHKNYDHSRPRYRPLFIVFKFFATKKFRKILKIRKKIWYRPFARFSFERYFPFLISKLLPCTSAISPNGMAVSSVKRVAKIFHLALRRSVACVVTSRILLFFLLKW